MWIRKKQPNQDVKLDGSMHAMDEASEHLVEVQLRAPEVKQIAQAAREVRSRNHFAEQLQEMLSTPRHRKFNQ